jgi:16S rRNA (guanine966-N2)-methyltransferase
VRVIAGKAKRLQLKTLKGLETRPTTDRIKETLFNMIAPRITDSDFLDLFSGSGAIGIEALSRGARYVAFVENNKEAIECIKSNLNSTKLEEGKVLFMDVASSIRALELEGKVFDIIFMDPPYNQGLEEEVIRTLQNSNIIYLNTLIIVEASIETSFSFLDDTKFCVTKEKLYKTNKHVFIELK